MLFVAAVSSVSSQITLNCSFNVSWIEDYGCFLDGVEVLDLQANVTIVGEHLPNRTNADVEFVQILNSNTPFVIPQLFAEFPNMNELEIRNSNLQTISLPPNTRLVWLILFGNNISRIENGTFVNQPELTYISATNNSIRHLDVNAFDGLEELHSLGLINNQIEEVEDGTLAPLISATVIDFEGNLLSEVSEGMFATNRNISTLYLERNRISAVHPNFARNMPALDYINLTGNLCVSQSFSLGTEAGRMAMNNALQSCFNRGVLPDARTICLEFVGGLTIYDNFGNLIGRF